MVQRLVTGHKINPANDTLDIRVMDEPGVGGANHVYEVVNKDGQVFMTVMFQNGPIAESGVNGVTQEVLLAIVEDRLKSFQNGAFACDENAKALEYVTLAQRALFSRTLKRMARGVEGTHTK